MFFQKTKSYFCAVTILFVLCFSQNIVEASPQTDVNTESIYTTIATRYLPSFEIQQKEAPKNEKQIAEEIEQKKKINSTVTPLSEREQREIVFSLFSRHANKDSHSKAHVFEVQSWDDLELFCGPTTTKTSHLFSPLNKTCTVMGEAVMARMLVQATTDIKTLRNRIEIEKMLVDNENLANELETELNNIKKAEPIFYSSWKDEGYFNQEFIDKLYYSKNWFKRLNQSTTVLETTTRLRQLFSLIQISAPVGPALISSVAMGCLLGPITAKELGKQINPITAKELGKQINNAKNLQKGLEEAQEKLNNAHSTLRNTQAYETQEFCHQEIATYEQIKELLSNMKIEDDKVSCPLFTKIVAGSKFAFAMTNKPFIRLIKNQFRKESTIQAKLITGGILAVVAYFFFNTAKNIINSEKNNINMTNYLQKKLIAVSSVVGCLKNIVKIIDAYPSFKQLLSPRLQEAIKLENQDKKFTKLVEQLDTRTFKGSASAFSLSGRILATHKLMEEVKNMLIPALEAIGELDAYLAISKLHKSPANQNAKYCFVDFVENAQKPYIEAQNFWFPALLNNPKLKPESIVPNSITMEHQRKTSHILLTGPNTGGKSTILKGIITTLLLAQSFGIAPATKVTLTPFAKIQTYLNIADNSSSGESLFQAELNRSKTLIESLKSLDQRSAFSFTILDEIFNGTAPNDAVKGSAAVALHIAQMPNCMSILSTHFNQLTALERQYKTHKNYRVNVNRNTDGSLSFPYTWGPGINNQHIAQELIKNADFLDAQAIQRANSF